MKLVRINKNTYINPTAIDSVIYEKDLDAEGDELQTKSWYVYVGLDKIQTPRRFSVRRFLLECR